MPNCPTCGQPTATTDVFCDHCGVRLPRPADTSVQGSSEIPAASGTSQRTCPTCGQSLAPSARFCMACGTPVSPTPTTTPEPAQSAVSWTPAPSVPPTPSTATLTGDRRPSLGCYLGASAAALALIGLIVAVAVGLALLRSTDVPAAPVATSGSAPEAPPPPTTDIPTPTALADQATPASPTPAAGDEDDVSSTEDDVSSTEDDVSPTGDDVSPTAEPLPTDAPPAATTAPAAESPPITGISDATSFYDEFSTAEFAWSEMTNDNGGRAYQDGAYVLQDKVGMYISTIVPSEFFPTSIEFDAALGPDRTTGEYGVICHFQDQANWDTISIHPGEGSFHVAQLVDDEYREVTSPMWQAAPALDTTPGVFNHILIDCTDDEIGLFINDTYMGHWTLPVPREPSPMHVFVYGYHQYEDPYTVIFDNVGAWIPVQ